MASMRKLSSREQALLLEWPRGFPGSFYRTHKKGPMGLRGVSGDSKGLPTGFVDVSIALSGFQGRFKGVLVSCQGDFRKLFRGYFKWITGI